MYPYHVEVDNQTVFFQLSDGRFQFIKPGPLAPVMVGFKYVLIKKSIADILKEVNIERISFKPAIIWNRKDDFEDLSYCQMIVNHHFNSENLIDLNLDGLQFLLMDERYLFVTPKLKIKLEKLPLDWKFSEGFGNFG